MKRALLAAALAAAAWPAGARQVDPAPYAPLIERYADACHALSATECEIARPVGSEDAARLACLFDELDRRAGDGTAAAHVGWAEGFAATGQPPADGFPASLGQQEILVRSLIACGADTR